jgi:ubiquinone/menaquinone biosynthesis C-methylase UbiE
VPSREPTDRLRSATARRYDRTAPLYDLYDRPMDVLGGVRRRRRRLLGAARGDVLEVGVGTGRNLDLYPRDVRLTGIDISPGMLAQARDRVERLGRREVTLSEADVERLPFQDDSFDTVVATCVFCSVDDPVAGLREVARVTRPSGAVLLLEHVRPRNRWLGAVFDVLTVVTRRLLGFHVNRETVHNLRVAGLDVDSERSWGIWREIVARPGPN